MTSDSIISLTGTIVTVIAMVVAIWQARAAKNYKEQIKFDIRKINLSGSTEKLKRAQDDIRKLPASTSAVPRGIKVPVLIPNIKSQFDFSFGVIDSNGPDKDIRLLLTSAQQKLNSYELGWNANSLNPSDLHELQSLVQDAIAQSNSRILILEGKV